MIRINRIAVIFWALVAFAVALVVRSGELQLWQGAQWTARAERQHVSSKKVPAPRGEIRDASGTILAESRQLVRLGIAPREVKDRRALARALGAAGVPRAYVSRATDTKRAWVDLPGRFVPTEIATLTGMRGIYPEPVIERVYTPSIGLRSLIGRANGERGIDGLELGLDSILRGTQGLAPMLRDARGRGIESPEMIAGAVAARPGHTIVLTVNYHLQEIADRALSSAVAKMNASGGDIVIVDPFSGAVLAMASHRPQRATAATAFTEPFEPGSTLKPLVAATLLSLGRARADEVIDTHDGIYRTVDRTITDLHKEPSLSLADVIRWSSNVGIVRFAERLTPDEQYTALRDFGFGMPTGSPYPSEATGTLRPPSAWSRVSAASLAMGYEIAVTPMQLAMAYASIANGGELLEPALIREIRTPDGDVVFRHHPRVVRRVMEEDVAEQVREMLADVVEKGTAMEADLSTFAVGGKTGTTRTALVGQRGYLLGKYFATFVGLFPAEEPQYVVLVKLDRPAGNFGGATAAPVSRTVLEAALAARDAALNRESLAEQSSVRHEAISAGEAVPAVDTTSGTVPVVVSLESDAPPPVAIPPRKRAIPDVRGLPLRDAVRALHDAGFRVELAAGEDGVTWPAAGAVMSQGAVVRLQRGR